MSQALYVSQLANRVNSVGKLDAKNGLFNWPLDDLAQQILPSGTILIWSGIAANIPMGWQLCDGTNGTPDLRSRFVMGGGGSVIVGTTGGSANYTLTLSESNLPAHTHSMAGITTSAAGSHTHSASSGGLPDHKHYFAGDDQLVFITEQAPEGRSFGSYDAKSSSGGGGGGNMYKTTGVKEVGSGGISVTIDTAGSHSHTIPPQNTGSTGTGTAISIPTNPAFYALCYIMRLPYSGSNSLESGPPAPGLGGTSGGSVSAWTVEPAVGGVSLRITAEDNSYKNIKLTAGSNIVLTRITDGELTIGATFNFDFEGSWNTKKTTDLPEASPARYWTPTREAAVTTYIDENDYLNFYPTAGVLKENKVPVYASFAFSIQAQGLPAFWLTDNQNFDTAYFHTNTPYGLVRPYRAYRFDKTSDFFYDTEALTLNFTTSDEYVMCLYNMGTYFAYVILGNKITPSLRKHWLVKTFASSKSQDWQAYLDVTSLAPPGATVNDQAYNFFLMLDTQGDRILRVTMADYSLGSFVLDVYDNQLVLIRSQILVSVSDFDKTNIHNPVSTGWNTQPYNGQQYSGYSGFTWLSRPPAFSYPFTWNKYTEELLFCASGYFIAKGSPNVEQGTTITISWQIPKTWLLDGSGTTINNISDKGSGVRYKLVPDSTWDTSTGGCSSYYTPNWGWSTSVTTDEYANRVTLTRVSHWSSSEFAAVEFNNEILKTIGSNLIGKQKSSLPKITQIPDASTWSKLIYAWLFHVIDDNILVSAFSTTSQWQNVSVDFLTNKFETRPVGDSVAAYNTLYLDPLTAKTVPNFGFENPWDGSYYTTTVISGQGHYYRIKEGQPVTKITLSAGSTGNTRKFDSLPGGSFTLPPIPSTIGTVINITNVFEGTDQRGPIVYNGNDNDKKFWAAVKGQGSLPNQLFIAKYSNGSWSSIAGPFYQADIDRSNTAWGDTGNRIRASRGCPLLTESGKFIFQWWMLVPGGGYFMIMNYDTVNDTVVSPTPYQHGKSSADNFDAYFKQSSTNRYSTLQGVSGYYGDSFGYSSKLGYYCASGLWNQLAIVILSSKDPRPTSSGGSATVYTETQWWNGPNRHEINFSAEPTVGLLVYVRNFPLFVGGYYGNLPNQTLAVPANKTSWIYAIKPDSLTDRRNITVQVSDEYQPSSFKKVNLGSVTTTTDKIIASEGYLINSQTWEPSAGASVNKTFTFTGRRASGNQGTFDLCVIRGLTVNGTIELAINFAATAGADKGSYQRAVFAVGTYVNSGNTGLYTIEAGTPVNRTVTSTTPFTYTRISVDALKISWNGTGLSSSDTNFALYLRINTNMFLTINRISLDGL